MLDNYEEAIKNYDMAINLSPQNSSLYYWRGRVNSAMELYADAIVDFNKAVEISPREEHAWNYTIGG